MGAGHIQELHLPRIKGCLNHAGTHLDVPGQTLALVLGQIELLEILLKGGEVRWDLHFLLLLS